MKNELSDLKNLIALQKAKAPKTTLSQKTIYSIKQRVERELEEGTMPLSGIITIKDPRDSTRILLTIVLENGSIVSSSDGEQHEHSTSPQSGTDEGSTTTILPASGG